MDAYLGLAIRIVCAGYILYKVWYALFIERLWGFWDRIPVREKKPVIHNEKKHAKVKGKVIGGTNKVLLGDPRKGMPEPVASMDLEPTGFIGQDEPVPPDDVDTGFQPYIPSDEELYEDDPAPGSDDMSSGVSYEELSQAAEVLTEGTDDEDKRTKAARTLYYIKDTEIFDLLAHEVSNKMAIEKLLGECLDGDGFPLKRNKPQAIAQFDISKYT